MVQELAVGPLVRRALAVVHMTRLVVVHLMALVVHQTVVVHMIILLVVRLMALDGLMALDADNNLVASMQESSAIAEVEH